MWTFLVAQMVKNLLVTQETWVWSLGQEDLLEKKMVIHSSILAWEIPWIEEPGSLQSMGLQRVKHDWATNIVIWTHCIAQRTLLNVMTWMGRKFKRERIYVYPLFCCTLENNSTLYSNYTPIKINLKKSYAEVLASSTLECNIIWR